MIFEVEFTREVTSHGYVTIDVGEFEDWINEFTDPGEPRRTLAAANDLDILEFLHSGREPWHVEHDLSDPWEVTSDPPELVGIKARDVRFPDGTEQLSLP